MTVLVVGQHPGVLVSSKGGRFGVTPASLPTGGTFPSPLANDEPSGGWVAGDEIAWRLDTVAAGGTVSATDQGDWSRTGAADGTYVSTYTRWVARADGTVDKASFTITDTIGSSGIVATVSITDAADALASAASVSIAGALSKSDANDALAAAGSVLVAASATLTDASDQLGAAGTVSTAADIVGTFVQTDASDALASTATLSGEPTPPVISLGGSRDRLWRDYMPDLPPISAKFWRLDDDDQVIASAKATRPKIERKPAALAARGQAALIDDDDVLASRTIVVRPLQLIRTRPSRSGA